ncbi:peptidase M28 [Brasilonema octagenarum UFV-E1]|uniref:Peptidase M28 n=1 Tax=Brasilonema sennae CENA114 TaxID=415709 RepID=A0A856MKJ2_9CYAN|nr:M28 family peptidase [Brasilonema sennae]QDL10660.1 peptidase M28 [Brasilonema sennae CENA114]QDL17007.1 peptidase M28 [Brasilonema octagenarum UFV-E1]
MKKRFWLLLVLLVTVVVIVVTNVFLKQDRESVVYSIRVNNPVTTNKDTQTPTQKDTQTDDSSASLHPPISDSLQVSSDKLFAHILRLNFTRNTPPERSRTRAYITAELKRMGWKPKLEKFPDGVNIFAEKPGTDKNAKAILVGAHYDTVYFSPGADDNASGVAVTLEIARLFGSHPTARTLQLAFFDKEEAGLLGSKAFVTNKKHLENLQGVIIMDMVGFACHTSGCQKYPTTLPVTPPSDKGDFLAVVGDTEHLPLLNAFQNSQMLPAISFNKGTTGGSTLPSVLTLPIPLKGLLTPDTLRSDHAPFWYQGVGAVLVTDTANLRTPHYHKSSDVPATIDREFFAGAAQVVVNATRGLLENGS